MMSLNQYVPEPLERQTKISSYSANFKNNMNTINLRPDQSIKIRSFCQFFFYDFNEHQKFTIANLAPKRFQGSE